ncbi:MAG: NADH dehydrogenase [Leptospiraceae bacterium]|nr:MAG: NADH dehydrogenase [Leptospiraceae bacterium]
MEQKMIKIKINDKEYEVPEGINVVEACDAYNIPLERFCYHRYLPVDGNCRTCMVEIETPRGRMLTIGCNTKVQDGMVIYTNSENAVRAQKASLEFLLLDHPLDCPICDKAGECYLQDNYYNFGLYEYRRIVPRYFKGGKAVDAGDHIVLDQERCILCTRCIRFLDHISGTSELGIVHRGHESKITTFPGKPISNDYSGNITDICPVGALTLKEFRFKQRVWFLKKTPSVCLECARGCSIFIEHNRGKIWRYMPRENPKLNRVWLCDKGRFSFKKNHENRIWEPQKNNETIDFNQATIEIENILQNYQWEEIAWLCGPYSSNETLYILKNYFGDNVYAYIPPATGKKDDLLMLAEEYPNEQGVRYFGINTELNQLVNKINDNKIKVLFIIENDIAKFNESKEIINKFKQLQQIIYFTPFSDETSKIANLIIPIRTFAETNGTYINATSILQKAMQAFEPENQDVPPVSLALTQIAYYVNKHSKRYHDPSEIFNELKNEYEELKDFTFSTIPSMGIHLKFPKIADEPFKNKKVDFNVFMLKDYICVSKG